MNDMGVERWVGVAAGLGVGLTVLYFLYGPRLPAGFFDFESDAEPVAEEPPPSLEAARAPTPPPAPEPVATGPQYPLPEPAAAPAPKPVAQAEPAPAIPPSQDVAVSDADVRASAAQVFGTSPVESFLVPERVVQNFVATVDSLDRDPIPLRFRVIGNVPEVPVVDKKGDQLLLNSDNDERYRMLADALRATDARQIAGLYQRYYPLVQRAYREMGYPNAHFNDRLVQIIDHLLAAPQVEHPIPLVRGKVLYHFADPKLEELSSGQKIMVRIGPANATIAKQRLRELRQIITAGKAAPAPTQARTAPARAPAPTRAAASRAAPPPAPPEEAAPPEAPLDSPVGVPQELSPDPQAADAAALEEEAPPAD